MPSSACKTCALRSEEHTSELQSHSHLVCRLLLEKTNYATRRLFYSCSLWGGAARASSRPCTCRILLYSPFCRRASRTSSSPSHLFFFFFTDTAPPFISLFPLPAASGL